MLSKLCLPLKPKGGKIAKVNRVGEMGWKEEEGWSGMLGGGQGNRGEQY